MRRLFFILFLLLLASCVPKVEQEITISPSFEEYYCEARDLIKACSEGFSKTLITCYELNEVGTKKGYRCYEGWKVYGEVPQYEKPYSCNGYHCYPQKGYCLLGGDVSNPPIPRKEACPSTN